jgi:hypothetical protein
MPSYHREHSDGTAVYKGGSTETLDNLKDMATGFASGLTDEAALAAATKAGLVNVAKNVKPSFNLPAMAVGFAANPLINLGEATVRGAKGMYQSRAEDVFKNLQAIKQFIPNDNKINSLIQQLQHTIQLGAQLFQRKASYNNKNTRLAIIGQFNAGQYGRDALIGAGTGAMVGAAAGGVGAIPGAILGAIGGGLGSGINDIAYQFKNNYQKASWQAGEMRDKLFTMQQQIQPFSPQLANMLMKLAQDIKNEIEVRFEKKSGASYRNDYDQTAQQGQEGQEGQGGMSQDGSSLDPNLSQAVDQALQLYNQAKQAYNTNPQAYEQLRMQYQQMLQQINAYIAQNYPGQDANQLLATYMQQANFGMQQQSMMQQPMMQQPIMQQSMMQQYYNQQPYNQQPYNQQPFNQQNYYNQQPFNQNYYNQQPFNQQNYYQQQPQGNYFGANNF